MTHRPFALLAEIVTAIADVLEQGAPDLPTAVKRVADAVTALGSPGRKGQALADWYRSLLAHHLGDLSGLPREQAVEVLRGFARFRA